MEIKKLNLKKGASILDIFLVTMLFIFGFVAIMGWINSNAVESSIKIPNQYNDTLNSLNENQKGLDTNLADIRDNINDLKEADNIAQVAFNGIKGVLALFKLPLQIIDPLFEIINQIFVIFYGIDKRIIIAIISGLTAVIIFAFLRFVTQRGNDA